jgi:hypothetical protein
VSKTRPTGEQLRFRSSKTGDHILDDYLEAVELGNRTLADILADTHATDTGLFRADIFQFRFDASDLLQFRIGDFPDANTGWLNVPNSISPQAYKVAAEAAQAAAEEARDQANTSASNAATSETNAATSESNAATSESNAQTSEANALTSENNAAASEANALTSENNAAASEANALTSENNAAASEANALASEDNAATSETNAAASADASQAFADASEASRLASDASAAAADTSETNAAASASSAETSETNAGNSASAASTSASNAATSEGNASTSAALAADWAEKPDNADVTTVGTRSARHWSNTAAATLANKSDVGHTHDDRYYTEAEADAQLATKAALAGAVFTGDVSVPSLNGGPLAGLRNKIINGGFDIWQRGTSFGIGVSASAFTADRANVYVGVDAAATVSRQAFTPGDQDAIDGRPEYYFRHARTTAATGGGYIYSQKIENVRLFSAKQITVSFWGRVSSGTLSVTPRLVQEFGSGGSAAVTVDAAAVTLTTTWQKFSATVSIPSEAGKTINTGNNLGLYLLSPTGVTFTADLAQVQLEEGPVATPFEQRPVGLDLALCQRYYAVVSVYGRFQAAAGSHTGGWPIYFPQPMRVLPSLTEVTSSQSATNSTNPTVNISNNTSGYFQISSVAAGSCWLYNRILLLDAEL